MADTYTIGQVAEITGISRDRLRYYEEKDYKAIVIEKCIPC